MTTGTGAVAVFIAFVKDAAKEEGASVFSCRTVMLVAPGNVRCKKHSCRFRQSDAWNQGSRKNGGVSAAHRQRRGSSNYFISAWRNRLDISAPGNRLRHDSQRHSPAAAQHRDAKTQKSSRRRGYALNLGRSYLAWRGGQAVRKAATSVYQSTTTAGASSRRMVRSLHRACEGEKLS